MWSLMSSRATSLPHIGQATKRDMIPDRRLCSCEEKAARGVAATALTDPAYGPYKRYGLELDPVTTCAISIRHRGVLGHQCPGGGVLGHSGVLGHESVSSGHRSERRRKTLETEG